MNEQAGANKAGTAEGALLLCLLQTPPDAAKASDLAAKVGDWPLFLALTRRHRVVSLATARLPADSAPASTMDGLRVTWHQRNSLGLRQVAEAAQLMKRLQADGVACLLLKGPGLSERAYGQPLLRDGRDIDILIAPAQLPRAEATLRAAGLVMEHPFPRSPRVWRRLHLRYSHEFLLKTPSGILVELKTRLSPTASLLPMTAKSMLARHELRSVAGKPLAVPGEGDLLLYLCSHGARHCWFRLKWLADVSALLSEGGEEACRQLLAKAEALGAEVPVLEAMSLCHHWLTCPIPADLLAQAHSHPLVTKRRPMVEACVWNPSPLSDPGFNRLQERAEYLLRADAVYRLALLERHTLVRAKALLRRLF